MKTRTLYRSLLIAVLLLLFLAAAAFCAEQLTLQEPDLGCLSLSSDGAGWTKGTFSYQGKMFNIEIYRGKRIPEAMRGPDGSDPEYIMDMCLYDQNGIFVTQFGGDTKHPEWDLLEVPEREYTPEEKISIAQTRSMLSTKMVTLLKEKRALENFASIAPEINTLIESNFAVRSLENKSIWFNRGGQSESSVNNLRTVGAVLGLDIFSKPAFFEHNPVGEHSGTYLYRMEGGQAVERLDTYCNYGACPGASTMRLKCWQVGTNIVLIPAKGSLLCTTPVQWNTVDPWDTNGKHVCNDDTYVQIYYVLTGQHYNYSGGTCGDTTLRTVAPCDLVAP